MKSSHEPHGDQKRFPRISRPLELLRTEYDVVVIGSGYGGGVASSRMARGGQSVCVLERGRERWPGEYPSTLEQAIPELHVSGHFQPGDKKGHYVDKGKTTSLYHLVVGQGQNAFVGNGLGGTSLLNANIFLKTDAKTQALNVWPPELRKVDALEKYYARAEAMLQPEPYPQDYPSLPKLDLLKKQRDTLGFGAFYRPPQTTRFEDGLNNAGVQMKATTLTGMDSTGINDGSKSSTLVNYLSDAWNWGAEIFCECEVRFVLKSPAGGYNVFFAWHGAKRDEFPEHIYLDLMFVHAKKLVFFGGGALGTTEILLRSQEMGLPLSSRIGTEMSGNGDILAFGYNMDTKVDSVGRPEPPLDRPVGPTITGVIDCRDQPDPLDGFVIEEGAVPQALAKFYQLMLETLPGRLPTPVRSYQERLTQWLAATKSHVFGPYTQDGSTERTQVYLIMSHDSNQAIMTLQNNKPNLSFLGVGRSQHVKQLTKHLADMTHAFGGTYVNSPFYTNFGQQEITVHPVGGACISGDGTGARGGANHIGELFVGEKDVVHDGLFVVDGAAVPTALGVNPFATITALAERSVEAAALKNGISINYDTRNGPLDLFGEPTHKPVATDEPLDTDQALLRSEDRIQGIGFSEVMQGFVHIGPELKEYEVAARAARATSQGARFFLSVRSWNLNELLNNPEHAANLTGTFTSGALPASPYIALRGKFQLFNSDHRTPNTKNLTYDFDMVGTDGSILHFHGYKVVDASIAGSPLATWRATSTLYVDITDPAENRPIGKGTLHIEPSDFTHELATFASTGPTTLSRFFSETKFLSFFTAQLLPSFLGPFARLVYPATLTAQSAVHRPTPASTEMVTSSDAISSPVHYFPATTTSTSTPLLLIPGASVDEQIFALPTIRNNAVEFFNGKGYDVYTITHRVGKHPAAKDGWTTFDARLDVAAGLSHVYHITGHKVYIVAHCAGSIALACGLLDATIDPHMLVGVTITNVFMHPLLVTANRVKAHAPIPLPKLYQATTHSSWFDCSSTAMSPLVQRALDQVLRFYPVGSPNELCESTVCHRGSLAFGRLWTHSNLNSSTHAQLERFLSGVSIPCLSHLVDMGKKGEVLNNARESLVTPANVQRLKGLRMLLISGGENVVFGPESTERDLEVLSALGNGNGGTERYVAQGRGHLDCWMAGNAKVVWERCAAHVSDITKGKGS